MNRTDRNCEVPIPTLSILGVAVGISTMAKAVEKVNEWVRTTKRPCLITFANVHMVVEGQVHPDFRRVLAEMDLNFPDGAPLFWLAKNRFGSDVEKISGPDFMPAFCEQSVPLSYRHFLYGGAPGVAEDAARTLESRYPGIQIVGHESPPYHALTKPEMEEAAQRINATGADVVWVGLGCPKQEQWMNKMRDLLNAKVVLAVGQAFDILAGRTNRAPERISASGLEWAYRLVHEPRRLGKRYLVTNTLFVCFYLRALLIAKYREQPIPAARDQLPNTIR